MAEAPWGTRGPAGPRARHRHHSHHLRQYETLCRGARRPRLDARRTGWPSRQHPALRMVLVLLGLIFIFGIYTLGLVWPSGWGWGEVGPRSLIPSHYLTMIIGVYATLGVFLIIASKNPAAHASLIRFTVWSSFVHGA